MKNYQNIPDLSSIKNILVIKLRHLGDVLLTTPVFSELKRKFPKAKIDVYVYEEAKEVLTHNPDLSEIVTLDRNLLKQSLFSRLKEELRTYCKFFREKKYDLVINLTEGDRGAFSALATRAKIRLGMESKKRIHKKCFTHFYKSCPKPRHSVERNLDALRRLGIFPEGKPRLTFVVPEESRKKIKSMLAKQNVLEKKFLFFHPSSRWRFKCLPQKSFQEFSKKMIEKGFFIVFSLGKEKFEEKMIREISKDFTQDQVLILPSHISIKELGALIEMSSAMVSIDSFPAHLGAALQTKGIVLFGPTCEITWGPWQNNELQVVTAKEFSCRPCLMDGCGGSKVSECLKAISVKSLVQELLGQLTN